jgi:hypothetical protein
MRLGGKMQSVEHQDDCRRRGGETTQSRTEKHPFRSWSAITACTHVHNTLSSDNTDVQVFYPFHPIHLTIPSFFFRDFNEYECN